MRLPAGTRSRAASSRSPPASSSGFSALPRLAPSTMATAASGAHRPAAGQPGDEQHPRHAGMRRPGHHRGQQQVGQGQLRHRAQQGPQGGGGLHRRHGRHHQVQRQQHQPEPDGNPPEISHLLPLAAAEGQHADQHQRREYRRRHRRTAAARSAPCRHWRPASPPAPAPAPPPRPRRRSRPSAPSPCWTAAPPSPRARPGRPGPRPPSATPSTCRNRLPKARCTPLWTMCRPQSSSAASPASSSSSRASAMPSTSVVGRPNDPG